MPYQLSATAAASTPQRPPRAGVSVRGVNSLIDVSDIPASTLRAIVAEAAQDVIHTIRAIRADDVAIVHAPPHDGCDVVECLPLGPELDLDPDVAGHLHRPADPVLAGSTRQDAVTAVSLEAAAALVAAGVARDLLDVQLVRARHEAEHLRRALESNRTVGVAIGVLMAVRHVDADQALAMLKAASRDQNRKVHDIAVEVALTGTIAT